jgi:hypothetical protein
MHGKVCRERRTFSCRSPAPVRSAEFLWNVICFTQTQAGGEYGRPALSAVRNPAALAL